MARTKVFQSGNSQAVRLPKAFRFDADEVEIFKRGDEVVLRPVQPVETSEGLWEALGAFSDDFMKDGREQPPMQDRPLLDEFFK